MLKKLLLILLIINNVSTNIFSQKRYRNITFPVLAKNMNDDKLYTTIENNTFVITPRGKLSWRTDRNNSIQLKTVINIEYAYLYKFKDVLFVFYTEFDGEDATSRV